MWIDRESRLDPANRNHVFGALTANEHAVLWAVIDDRGIWRGKLAGRFIPSGRALAASVPRKLAGGKGGPVLDSSHVYVTTERGAPWRALFPTVR